MNSTPWLPRPLLVRLAAFMVLSTPLALGGDARADEGSGPINLGLFPPVQIVKQDQSVSAFRLSLFYGRNVGLTGVDLSLVGRWDGDVTGVQFTAVGMVEGDFKGWQNGWLYNSVKGKVTGFQNAAINDTNSAEGFLFGLLVNKTQKMSGFQLGIVNMTEELSGLQIGILNIAKNAKGHTILPIVNWVF